MNNNWLTCITLTLAFFLCPLTSVSAQETSEQSLIVAWENIQKSDPQTLAFEKISDNLYQFKTKRFPFDGKLRVINTSIDDYLMGDANAVMGVVEFELETLPADFFARHARSYGLWEQTNTLYFTPETNLWLPYKQFQAIVYQPASKSWWNCVSLSDYFWLVLLIIIVAFLLFITKKANRQISSAMTAQEKIRADHQRVMDLSEKSVQISQDSNLVLKSILDELKKNK